MKFITELDLRQLYREHSFTSYQLTPDTKLTPEARQFLVDRKINILQSDNSLQQETVFSSDTFDLGYLDIMCKLESLEAVLAKVILNSEKANTEAQIYQIQKNIEIIINEIRTQLVKPCDRIKIHYSYNTKFSILSYLTRSKHKGYIVLLADLRAQLIRLGYDAYVSKARYLYSQCTSILDCVKTIESLIIQCSKGEDINGL